LAHLLPMVSDTTLSEGSPYDKKNPNYVIAMEIQ
jgi:hypothetical protein